MSEYIPLAEYLEKHKDKREIEKRLISGELIAFGFSFDPDRDSDEVIMTHYIKDGKKFEFKPEPQLEQIARFYWKTGAVDWENASIKIEQEAGNASHISLKWWGNITVLAEDSSEIENSLNEFPQSKSREALHIKMYEKAFLTLRDKNKEIPTARQVWNFIKIAVNNHEDDYSDVIQEVTSDKIFLVSFGDEEDRPPYKYSSFRNQMTNIKKKYKKDS